jgi:hypothetical protein
MARQNMSIHSDRYRNKVIRLVIRSSWDYIKSKLVEDKTKTMTRQSIESYSNEYQNKGTESVIKSNWDYLKSKLVEVGFVKTRTNHGVEIYEGNSDSYKALIECFDDIGTFENQTYIHYKTSKIIVQSNGSNTYTAWCA